jgi:hypothetical protein
MKFYSALLLLSASLALANNLEVSDMENDVAGNGFDNGFGESSEPEIDHNTAPVENGNPSVPTYNTPSGNNVPASPPVTTNPTTPGTPGSPSTPVDSTSGYPTDNTSGNYPTDNTSGNFPTDSTSTGYPGTDGISGNDTPAGTPAGTPADAGEASDDYGNDASINNIDNAPVPADGSSPVGTTSDNAENGEASDDYGDTNAVDNLDNADVNSNDTNDAGAEQSADEGDDSSNTGAIAAGVAGAAALSSAGVFLWVKRSKRNQGYVQSVRTQISMV